MGQSLAEWVEQTGTEGLFKELEIHAEMSDPKDFARHAMISFRQWQEGRPLPMTERKRTNIAFDMLGKGESPVYDYPGGYRCILMEDGTLVEVENRPFPNRTHVPMHELGKLTVPGFVQFSGLDEVIVIVSHDKKTMGILGMRKP